MTQTRAITQTTAASEISPVADSRRWWALAALSLAMLTIGLDTTVLNVALPTIATSLHASTSQLQWFSAAYTLVLGALMLPAGSLGDRFGRKKLLIVGLVIFGAASAVCAAAGSPSVLIGARALLGLGGAIMMPLSLAMLPVLFSDSGERARAMTIWLTASVIGLPLGPILGGFLLDHFWWGSVFLINVPLALVGVGVLAVFLPESRSSEAHSTDLLGVVLSSLGLVGVIYGFIQAGQHGWGSAAMWLPVIAGLVLLAAFLWWERRAKHPLIDLALFANRDFSIGTALATLANFALFGLIFATPQYFQAVEAASPLGTGIRLLPMIAGMLAGTQLAPRVIRRVGPRSVIAAGFVLCAGAMGVAAATKVGTGYGFAAIWITVLGAGIGFALPASMTLATGALSTERAGSGSALIQALRQVGGTIGVAILGTLLNSGYHSTLHTNHLPLAQAGAVRSSAAAGVKVAMSLKDDTLLHGVRVAFVHGMDFMLIVSGALALGAAVLALVVLPRVKKSAPVTVTEPGTGTVAL